VIVATDLTPRIGLLVCYYLEGWRYGYLEGVRGATATIRPVAAYGGSTPRALKIPTTDIER
jgi:hypothetical protein